MGYLNSLKIQVYFYHRMLLTILLLLLATLAIYAQEVFPGGGAGSYNLTAPTGNGQSFQFDVIGHGNEIYARPGATWKGPFQTHNWWNSGYWNLDPGCRQCQGTRGMFESQYMYPLPLYLKMLPDGFSFGYRTIAQQGDDGGVTQWTGGNGTIATAPFDMDMHIGDGANTFYTSTSSVVADYGDWHVKFEQHLGSTTLYTTAAKGSPFVFFDVQGTGIPYFQPNNGGTIKVIAKYNNAILVNTYANGLPVNPKPGSYPEGFYAFFFPAGTQLVGPGGSFQPLSSINTGDVISPMKVKLPPGQTQFTMAVMPDNNPASLQVYEPHAYCVITDTRFTYSYDPLKHHVSNKFDVSTVPYDGHSNTPGTLQALFRHQYLYSPEAKSAKNTGLKYFTARHFMEVLEGNSFTTEMNYYGSLPELGKAAKNMDETHISKLVTDLFAFSQYQAYKTANYDDYNFFRSLGIWMQAAEVANQIKRVDLRDNLVDHAKVVIEDFFTSPSDPADWYQTVYSPKLNMMTTYPNSFYSMYGMYDYHFVVAYIIYAAAIVGKYDAERTGNLNWVNKWKPMIDLMVRNIDDWNRDMVGPADKTQPWFPYLRFFDPYAGHSWFSNMTVAQEAISESVLFATGAMLWGDLTDNKPMRDMGAMLFVTESEAGRQYWFDYDNVGINKGPFKPNFPSTHAGIVREDGYAYSTFYDPTQPNTPVAIHRADLMPITGSSVWLGTDIKGVQRDFQSFQAKQPAFNFTKNTWSDELLAYQALYDATTARLTYDNNVFNGNPPAMSLDQMLYPVVDEHWIATLDSVGHVDARVQADVPFFSVFYKDTCDTWIRHYMMYNSPGTGADHAARVVHFTDGTCWWMPADTLITYKLMGPDTIRKITAGPDICLNAQITISVDVKICSPRDPTMYYEYSTDNVTWKKLFDVKTANDSLSVKWTPPDAGTYRFRAIMRGDTPPGLMCPVQDTSDNVATVVVSNCCAIDTSFSTVPAHCNKSDGSITVKASGGAPSYTYKWNDALTQTTAKAMNLKGGNYSVTITDSLGCKKVFTKALLTTPATISATIGSDKVLCMGDSVKITFTAGGGLAPYTYIYAAGATNDTLKAMSGIFSKYATPAKTTVYSIVSVADANGCFATPSGKATVTMNPDIVYSKTSMDAHCGPNGSATLLGTSGGVGPYSYKWDSQTGGQTTSTATAIDSGLYVCVITDASGCSKKDSVKVKDISGMSMQLHTTNPKCAGGCDGTASVVIQGGTIPYTYAWSKPATGATDSVNKLCAGNYKVTAKDKNNCQVSQPFTLQNPDSVKVLVIPPASLCLTGPVSLKCTPSGGSPAYTYTWDPDPSLSSLSSPSPTVTPVIKTTYILHVKDANFCLAPPASITLSPGPKASFTTDTIPDCTQITVKFKNTSTAGIPPLQSQWTFNAVTSSSIAAPVVKLNPGRYSFKLRVTDANGCTDSVTHYRILKVPGMPVASFSYGPEIVSLFNPEVAFKNLSKNAVSYSWTFGTGDSSSNKDPVYSYRDSGSYTICLTAKSPLNCVASSCLPLAVHGIVSFYVPSAFTPDGNGSNDSFLPVTMGLDPQNYEMLIFNRWGEQIFASNDVNKGWDGNYMGNPAQVDVYVWKIKTREKKSRSVINKIGQVTLMR